MPKNLSQDIQTLAAEATSRYDLCAKFINQNKVKSFAEIGVWRGEFAEHILKSCPSIERYYMVDPWQHLEAWNKPANVTDTEFEDIFSEAMQRTDFARDKRVVLRQKTREALATLQDAELDAAYVDSDHTLKGITVDLVTLYDKITPGGHILGDDFVPNIWQHSGEFEPTLVFPFAVYFAEAKGDTIYGLPFNQFLISKTPDPNAFDFQDLTGNYQETGLLHQILKRPKPHRRTFLQRVRGRMSRLLS